MTQIKRVYEVCPRRDHRGFDLISDALPFGRLWYTQVWHAIGYAEFRRRPLCDFQKKACGSGGARVGKLSAQSDKAAKRRWHTDTDRRSLVWKILSGARLSRREEALPVSCES